LGNSTVRVIDAVDYLQSFPELVAVLPIAGYSVKKVLQVTNQVMTKMLSSAFKWPWNRGGGYGVFITNSWQQDYALNLFSIGFLQDSTLLDINNTSNPRPIWPIEAVQNLPVASQQFGRPGQLCVLYNKDLQYATWGATGQGTGNFTNPQPGQTITQPIGQQSAPANPNLQVRDPNGNLWVLTQFGTLGLSQPTWPTSPVYPTYKNPSIVPTVVDDGTAQWTAVNPNGQGFRVSPMPPMTGIAYQVWPVWQCRPIQLTTMQQVLEPIPDDVVPLFFDGLVAVLWQQHPDPKVRIKHIDAINQWEKSLNDAKHSGDRTRDSAIMYPSDPIMQTGGSWVPSPAFPWGPPN
jgi:hypothetical protein